MGLKEEFKTVPVERLKFINETVKSGKISDPKRFASEFKQLPINVAKAYRTELAQMTKPEVAGERVPDQGIGTTILETAVDVGEFIDKFTGAPIRKGIGELQKGKGFIDAAGSAFSQIGADPRTAPTGKQIASQAGVSKEESISIPGLNRLIGDVSPAGIIGLGIDIFADPTILIPAGALGKLGKGGLVGAAKASKAAVKGSAKSAAKIIDFVTNTKYGNTSLKNIDGAIGNATEVITNKLKPGLAPDLDEMTRIAEKNGLDFELSRPFVEFPEESLITKATKVKAQGPLGEPLLDAHKKSIEQVNRAVANKISDLGGGKILSPSEIGISIKDGIAQAKEKLFSQIDLTYNGVSELNPGLFIQDVAPDAFKKFNKALNSLENKLAIKAEKGLKSGVGRAQAADLLEDVRNLKLENGNFKGIANFMSEIGEVAFKGKGRGGTTPPNVQALRDLYFDAQEAIIEATAKSLGDDAAFDLINNNRIISEFFTDKSVLKGVEGLADEKVFEKFIKNADSKQIQSLKSLAPESIQQARSTLLDSFIKPDIDGKFTFKSVFNKIRDNESKLKLLFEPEELDDIIELLRYGTRLGAPIMNPSGTAVSKSFKEILTDIPLQLTNDQVVDSLKAIARQGGQKTIKASADIQRKGPKVIGTEFIKGLKPTRRQTAAKGLQLLSPQAESENNPINRALRFRRN